MNSDGRVGLVLVAGSALVWSLGGLAFRLIGADVVTVLAGRSLSAFVFLTCVLTWRERGHPLRAIIANGWPGLVIAVFFTVDSSCFMAALARTAVAHVVIVLSVTPLIAALAGWLLLKEPVGLRTWAAMAAAFVGVAIMVFGGLGGGNWQGDLRALVAACFFAGVTLVVRRFPATDLVAAVCLAALFSAVCFLPFAKFGTLPVPSIILMIFLGVGEFGAGLMLYLAGAKRVSPAEATLMTLLETVLAPLWVWLALSEFPGTSALIGGVVVLGALIGHAVVELKPAAS